jgi:hypothetical protein
MAQKLLAHAGLAGDALHPRVTRYPFGGQELTEISNAVREVLPDVRPVSHGRGRHCALILQLEASGGLGPVLRSLIVSMTGAAGRLSRREEHGIREALIDLAAAALCTERDRPLDLRALPARRRDTGRCCSGPSRRCCPTRRCLPPRWPTRTLVYPCT